MCAIILLNSNPLNARIRIIEHLLRLIKVVLTGENGFYMCCICQDHIQHNTKRHPGKAIMNTTRGDQTDDVVNTNNVKLVIIGDEGFMAPLFNTTKGDTTIKKLEKTHDVNENR